MDICYVKCIPLKRGFVLSEVVYLGFISKILKLKILQLMHLLNHTLFSPWFKVRKWFPLITKNPLLKYQNILSLVEWGDVIEKKMLEKGAL